MRGRGLGGGAVRGAVRGTEGASGAMSVFLIAYFGFDLGVRDGVGHREVGQPLGHYREVVRVFQVFHKLVVGRGDEVGKGIAGLGVSAAQGAGGLAQQGFAELRIAPGAGPYGFVDVLCGRYAALFLFRPCACVGVGQSAVTGPAGVARRPSMRPCVRPSSRSMTDVRVSTPDMRVSKATTPASKADMRTSTPDIRVSIAVMRFSIDDMRASSMLIRSPRSLRKLACPATISHAKAAPTLRMPISKPTKPKINSGVMVVPLSHR